MVDDQIRVTLYTLYDNLRTALGTRVPERSFIAPGASVSWDRAEQMWARLVEVYPSTDGIGLQDTRTRATRGPLRYSVVVELGVLRCSPIISLANDDTVVLPDPDDLTSNVDEILLDAVAMRNACTALVPDTARRNVLIGLWTPLGPEGGAAGGALQVTVQNVLCESSGDGS